MPIYEYECTCCSHRFELKQSFNSDGETACPKCAGKSIRVFSPVPIIFKGPGFYVTDYPKGGYSPESSTSGAKTGSTD